MATDDDAEDKPVVQPPLPPPPLIPAGPTAPAVSGASYPYINDPLVPGRRLFNDAAIQRQLNERAKELDAEGKTGAVVLHADTDGNATLSVIGKKGDHWTYMGQLDHSPDVKLRGSAQVRFSW